MNVLVTGAAGFIGSHLCEALVARGHEVIGVDSFDDYLYPAEVKRENAREAFATLPPERFELVEASLEHRDTIAKLVDRAEVVAHLAALAGVRPSLAEPLRYLRTNVEGTGVILEAMRRSSCRRLVFASSSSVYGARPGDKRPFSETDACVEQASPYAATKRAGELLCSTYRDVYGIGVSALRFFTVYGPRQRPDMAIHRFMRAISAGETITLFGDGSSRRDYTYIDDIVAGTVAAIERVEPDTFNLYNLGGEATTSLAELVAAIEHVTGAPARFERRPIQAGDVPITHADIFRARQDLDYEPKLGLADGLARFWSWYGARTRE
jgi:UDP-glucuronate 4-epimerase